MPCSAASTSNCSRTAGAMRILNQQESADQVEKITGILFEMVNLLAEDLKAPRFMRAESGSVMMSGEAVPGIH